MSSYIILLAFALVGVCAGAPFVAEGQQENDPELTAGYFEGDIVLPAERTGLRNETLRWPNKIVYYKFFDKFEEPQRNHILRGMRIIEDVSCIRFKEADEGQEYYVNITGRPEGCFSSVGWTGRVQNYNLQNYPLDQGCFRLGTIVHEFLHTLGFYHMQSAHDRDEFVRIAEENIQSGKEHNFNKYEFDRIDDFDQEYDYGSVMHYSAFAFSANGEMTIVPLKEDASGLMGQRRGMSARDINRLNVMYRCPIKS